MLTYARFVGIKKGVTSKSKIGYADILLNFLFDDGTPDIEQSKIRSYDPSIIAKCELIKPGQDIALELTAREITITDIEVADEKDESMV